MKKHLMRYWLFYSIINSFLCFAGTDPVSWQVIPSNGFPLTTVGNQSSVVYSLVNHLPGRVVLSTQLAINGTGITVDDQCNGTSLPREGVCTVIIRYTPLISGTTTVQLTYGYNNNRIPLPLLTAVSQGNTPPPPPPTYGLTGIINNLPATLTTADAPFVSATFTNTGNTPLTNCQPVNALGFTVSPANAAQTSSSAPGTCGSAVSPITLTPNSSCVLNTQLTNLQATPNAALTASVNCSETSAAPVQNFSIQESTIACTTISVQPLLPFPTNTYKYADNVIKFIVTNQCQAGQPAVSLGQFTITPTVGTATIAPIPLGSTYDGCSNQLLNPGDNCTVTTSIIPTSVNTLTIAAGVTPAGGVPASITQSTTVATNQQPTHHILFVNQCNFDVWYGIANGTGSPTTPDPNLIANPAGAPPSAYLLPAQVQGQPPSTIDLATASYLNGAFWPRTGCAFNSSNNFTCTTGSCATITGSATCNSTGTLIQPQAPYTKFEANLSLSAGGDGIYDVSAINGMNVPVEVKAFGPSVGNTQGTVYKCSAAGALMQPASNSSLGNCSWNYDPSSTISTTNVNNDFYWVTAGANDGCTTSALPNLCGMAWGSGPDTSGVFGTPINRRQGQFLGFNTLNDYAAYTDTSNWGPSVNLFTKYGLNIEMPGQSTSSYGQLVGFPNNGVLTGNTYLAYNTVIGCPAVTDNGSLNSCYQTPTGTPNLTLTDYAHCCGCVDWTNTLPENACGYASAGQYASGMNYDWTGSMGATIPIAGGGGNYTPLQSISWIKNACPTAYSYTYDDPSSSFSCTEDEGTPILTSYQVTFCPGGVSSLPEGVAEGRNITS